MTKPLLIDTRERAMLRSDAGETVRAVAGALGVVPAGAVELSERQRSTGSAAPGKIGGHVLPKIRGDGADWLRIRMAGQARRCSPSPRTTQTSAPSNNSSKLKHLLRKAAVRTKEPSGEG
jgi:hypothetical protein